MAGVIAQRKVVYAGLWRQNNNSDHDTLLRQISSQLEEKRGLTSLFQLCVDGVKIVVLNDDNSEKKTEKIPGQIIQDITVNRYNPVCLITVFVDGNQRLNFLVCRCFSTSDASHLVHTYQERKRVASGEGYEINLKQPHGLNWTLRRKVRQTPLVNGNITPASASSEKVIDTNGNTATVAVTSNGFYGSDGDVFTNEEPHIDVEVITEEMERERCEIDGIVCFNVAVQTELDYDDRESITSATSLRTLKDELLNLSQEIRDIKFILEKSTGISSTEYLKRERDVSNHAHSNYVPVPVVPNDEIPSPCSKSSSEGDRHVNFGQATSVSFPDHNIRSLGVQTEKGRTRYTKRQPPPLSTQSRNHAVRTRSRSSSASSAVLSPSSLSPTASHENYYRHDMRCSTGSYRSTIERPIEQVYNVYTQEFRQPRRKSIVMPGSSATMPPMRWPNGNARQTPDFDRNRENK